MDQQSILDNFLNSIAIDPRAKVILYRHTFLRAVRNGRKLNLYFKLINPLAAIDLKFLDTYLSSPHDYHYEFNMINVFFESDTPIENIRLVHEYNRYFAEKIGKESFLMTIINSVTVINKDMSIQFTIDNKIYHMHQDHFALLQDCLKQYGCCNKVVFDCTEDDSIYQEAEQIIEPIVSEKIDDKPINKEKKLANTFSGRIFDIKLTESARGLYAEVGITNENESRYVSCNDTNIDADTLMKLELDDLVEGHGRFARNSERFYANALSIVGHFAYKYSDLAENKRVELHVHTKMSAMDGVGDMAEYVSAAKQMGHKAIAVTDHGGVQAFPQAQAAGEEEGIKIIYGMEGYMIDPLPPALIGETDATLSDATYVIFDIETTGLSPEFDSIIEIGAVKVVKNVEEGIFQSFVHYDKPLSGFIKKLTNINESDVVSAPPLEQVLSQFLEFCKGAILVAHNAHFDYNFISYSLSRLNQPPLQNPIIDTLTLSKQILPPIKSYRLGSVCRHLDIVYNEDNAHRAQEDSLYLSHVFESLLRICQERNINYVRELNSFVGEDLYRSVIPYHVTLLSKSKEGLKNLYRLMSLSAIKYFNQVPRIPRHELSALRTGLLIGSSCYNGEIMDLAKTASRPELIDAIKFYDYIELQPLELYKPLVYLERVNENELVEMLRFIIDCAREAGVMIVATGDVHHVHPDDVLVRDIYVNSLAVGNVRHPLNDYGKKIKEIPNAYFRSTEQMYKDMSYLSEQEKDEFIVQNSNLIADLCEDIKPFNDTLYPPKIEDCDKKLTDLVYQNAYQRYGQPLPELIETRIKKELDCIILQNYAVIYYSAHLVVRKGIELGYLVGSRGSVGSSLVATFADITEVNPLPPHYICPNCHYFELRSDVGTGFDLPDRLCPKCGQLQNSDGQDIPFETFLGFDEAKVPDIDLNFSGECMQIAHEYVKEIFGEKNVFRAGTVLKIEDKKAYGYVKAYLENKGLNDLAFDRAAVSALARRCTGVKLTTGKHAGGVVVIPEDKEIEDFCPIQYPADSEGKIITTHIDYKALHDNILKLDLLGHIDPTVLRMLHELTGIDPRTLRLNDPNIVALFTSTAPLKTMRDIPNWRIGVAGLPEFGTAFVRRMVEEIEPRNIADVIKISGLSHGKKVWQNNIRNVVLEQKRNGIESLSAIIGCRDDIMTYLISKGVEPSLAFKIMEAVRKGKGAKVLNEKVINLLKEKGVPDWYVACCLKIGYLFPKAHASAYVIMALRIAWYKIYYPLEYYASYFTFRVVHYDIETLMSGEEATRHALIQIMQEDKRSDKQEALIGTFEKAIEMFVRGFNFARIDIHRSAATKFTIDYEKKELIPPFNCIEGLGDIAAGKIVEKRNESSYTDSEDFVARSGISKTLQGKFYELKIISEEDRRQLSFDF